MLSRVSLSRSCRRHLSLTLSSRWNSSIANIPSDVASSDPSSISSSPSWLSSMTSKLSLEIRQQDSNLEAMSSRYSGVYRPWFIERWLETPIHWVQDGLEIIHFGLGIPWWATIAVTAISVRLACFPLLMLNAKQVYGMMDTQPVFKLAQDEYRRKKNDGEFKDRMEEKQWFQELYHKTSDITGYRLWKLFAYPAGLLCSLPPFIFAARGIARRTNHDLSQGGLLWFTDLAKPDMYTILPFVAVTMTWCVFAYKAGRWLDGRYIGIFQKYASFFYFGVSSFPLMMVALFVEAPSGIYCYWIPFSFFGLFCKLFIHNEGIKKRLNMPRPVVKPTEPTDPELNKFYHSLLRRYKRIHRKPIMGSPSKMAKHLKPLKEIPSMTTKQLTNPDNSVIALIDKLKKRKRK